jgi:hypothetical protein
MCKLFLFSGIHLFSCSLYGINYLLIAGATAQISLERFPDL